MHVAGNPISFAPVQTLDSCKMDIVSCDLHVFKSNRSPEKAAKSLYFNAYNHLIRILDAYFGAIKPVALDAARKQVVDATEYEVKQVPDLRGLFECLKVDTSWNDLYFLDVAISSLPPNAFKEAEAARLVLGHYKSYLNAYRKAISIKEGKSVFGQLPRRRGRKEVLQMVVTEVTVDEDIETYTCSDCLELWKLFLINALEIPEDRIQFSNARPGNSTILVFMVPQTFAEGIKEKLSKPAAVWLMMELRILRVHIGVINVDLWNVFPSVPTVSIREGLKSGVDFISLMKVSVRMCICVHVLCMLIGLL